jgi:hypothetical protein
MLAAIDGAADEELFDGSHFAWTEGDPHPAVLTNDDLPDIIADDDAYFARKVDSTISAELLDALDAAAATWRPTAS